MLVELSTKELSEWQGRIEEIQVARSKYRMRYWDKSPKLTKCLGSIKEAQGRGFPRWHRVRLTL